MSIFTRFMARLTSPAPPMESRIISSPRTSSGVRVDADTALKNATVWACVQYLTKALSQTPWRVMLDEGKGGSAQSSHPVDWLIHKRPNPEMGSFTWRQSMLGQALLRGNAYAEIEWDNRGVPVALWPIRSDRVRVFRDGGGALAYDVWGTTGSVTLPAASVYHVRGYGDGSTGLGVVEYAAQSIGWAQATELFGANYFGEGMNPSGIVKIKKAISPDALAFLKAEMKRLYTGKTRERTAFLDNDMDFVKLATNPNDSQFIESMQFQVTEICRWFGVPPHKVMHMLQATFSNIEHQSIEVVVDSITPWARIFEEEADYKLFGANNRRGFYTKMNLNALLRGDNASRLSFYKGMFEMGALSTNDILQLEDMQTIGKDGDQRFRSQNLAPLDEVTPPAVPALPAPMTDDPVVDPVPTDKPQQRVVN